jgi:hypothetical protein
MDWLTFWTEVIKALAWPVTVFAIFLILRRPLTRLIPYLQRLRFRDIELDFGKQVEELAAEFHRELPTQPALLEPSRQLREHWEKLAPLSPRAVVLEAWLHLEEAAIEASRRHGLKLTSRELRSPILLGHALEEAEIIDESKLEIFHRLRNLRNAAAHASEFEFDPESALEYADLALRLADFIRSAKK